MRLFDFLKLKNEGTAFQAAQAIREAGFSLANVPYKRTVFDDGSGRRKLVVPFGKYGYVIHYFLQDDTVLILRVYHGRENRPHYSASRYYSIQFFSFPFPSIAFSFEDVPHSCRKCCKTPYFNV